MRRSRTGTELGRQVEPILASGELVPDELTIALIRERLSQSDASDGFVLDGFPRNLVQAEALDAMLDAIGRPLDAVLFFDLDDETATARCPRPRARGGARRRHAGGDRAPSRDLPRADRAGRRALPRCRDAPHARRGAGGRRGLRRDRGRPPRRSAHDHPQGPGGDRADRARRRARRSDDRARRRAHRARASRRASSTTSPARSSPRTAACPPRRGTTGPTRPRSASRRTRWSSTASPVRTSSQTAT